MNRSPSGASACWHCRKRNCRQTGRGSSKTSSTPPFHFLNPAFPLPQPRLSTSSTPPFHFLNPAFSLPQPRLSTSSTPPFHFLNPAFPLPQPRLSTSSTPPFHFFNPAFPLPQPRLSTSSTPPFHFLQRVTTRLKQKPKLACRLKNNAKIPGKAGLTPCTRGPKPHHLPVCALVTVGLERIPRDRVLLIQSTVNVAPTSKLLSTFCSPVRVLNHTPTVLA